MIEDISSSFISYLQMSDDANFTQTHNVQSIHAFFFHQECHEPQLAMETRVVCASILKKKKKKE